MRLGAERLLVSNRSPERADDLAKELGATAVAFDSLAEHVTSVDVVITATGARKPLITPEMCAGRTKRLVAVDVSMPRNVDPAVADFDHVDVHDLDCPDLQTDEDRAERAEASLEAEAIVNTELQVLRDWMSAAPVRAALRPLERRLTQICQRELGYAIEDELARRTATRIVAKFMAGPMVALTDPDSARSLDAVETLAALFEEPSHERA